MKYNITSITDYLEELTGNKTRRLAHAKGKDKNCPWRLLPVIAFIILNSWKRKSLLLYLQDLTASPQCSYPSIKLR